MKMKSIFRTCILSVLVFILMAFMSIVSFAETSSPTWVAKKDMSVPRYGLGTASVNGRIYAIGGFGSNNLPVNTIEEYNPSTDTWTTKSPMPTARGAFAISVVDNKIYIIGGYSGSNNMNPSGIDILKTVEVYDPNTDTWTTKSPMPTARCWTNSTALNKKIYVVGGFVTNGNIDKVEEYDTLTDTWVSKNGIGYTSHWVGLATVNNKIYSVGGDNGSYFNTVKEYDPNADTWINKSSMKTPRNEHGIAVVSGKIYAICGYNGSVLSSVERYNPETDTWEALPNFVTTQRLLSACECNGNLYIVGGSNVVPAVALSSVYKWTINDQSSQATNLIAAPNTNNIKLTWNAALDGATGYNVKRSATAGGPYTTIATNVTGTSYTDSDVTAGTTYYYVVTAITSTGESANSNEASANLETPVVTGNSAILEITMTDGTIKEYDMTGAELDTFLKWYDDRSNGTGKSYFTITKKYNIKPFLSRKEYLPYDKIFNFEVKEYKDN